MVLFTEPSEDLCQR